MDALTLSRLRAQLLTPGQARRLIADMQNGGEAGRIAAERLGRSDVPRPKGPLIWCHVPGRVEIGALQSLRERLEDETAAVSLLVTSPDAARCRKRSDAAGVLFQHPPLDAPLTGSRFLDHWSPDAVVWFERVDAPLLLETAARRGLPLILQNARVPDTEGPRGRALERRLLGLFERILAVDPTEAEALRAFGAFPARIEATGRLTRITRPPSCSESERAELAAALHSRPVWLAAFPDPSELPAVLNAHRAVRRVAHRLLLILVPRRDTDVGALTERLRADDWTVARRETEIEPEEATDIFIGDCIDELGLFYRLAPTTFLGGTLSDTEVSPAIHPATLGSAIIAGPFSGNESETLRQLRRGGACRLVVDGDRLGQAVTELLAPDRAAQLALSAWEIVSEGSTVLDRLTGLLVSALRNRTA